MHFCLSVWRSLTSLDALIQVSVIGQFIVVEAKHPAREDEYGFIERCIIRLAAKTHHFCSLSQHQINNFDAHSTDDALSWDKYCNNAVVNKWRGTALILRRFQEISYASQCTKWWSNKQSHIRWSTHCNCNHSTQTGQFAAIVPFNLLFEMRSKSFRSVFFRMMALRELFQLK